MKRQFFTLLTTGVLCVSLTAGAFAGSPQAEFDKARSISKLEQKARWLERDAQATKGAGRQEQTGTARGHGLFPVRFPASVHRQAAIPATIVS